MEMLSNGILDIEDTEGEEISLTAERPQLTEEERLRIESENELTCLHLKKEKVIH